MEHFKPGVELSPVECAGNINAFMNDFSPRLNSAEVYQLLREWIRYIPILIFNLHFKIIL